MEAPVAADEELLLRRVADVGAGCLVGRLLVGVASGQFEALPRRPCALDLEALAGALADVAVDGRPADRQDQVVELVGEDVDRDARVGRTRWRSPPVWVAVAPRRQWRSVWAMKR